MISGTSLKYTDKKSELLARFFCFYFLEVELDHCSTPLIYSL